MTMEDRTPNLRSSLARTGAFLLATLPAALYGQEDQPTEDRVTPAQIGKLLQDEFPQSALQTNPLLTPDRVTEYTPPFFGGYQSFERQMRDPFAINRSYLEEYWSNDYPPIDEANAGQQAVLYYNQLNIVEDPGNWAAQAYLRREANKGIEVLKNPDGSIERVNLLEPDYESLTRTAQQIKESFSKGYQDFVANGGDGDFVQSAHNQAEKMYDTLSKRDAPSARDFWNGYRRILDEFMAIPENLQYFSTQERLKQHPGLLNALTNPLSDERSFESALDVTRRAIRDPKFAQMIQEVTGIDIPNLDVESERGKYPNVDAYFSSEENRQNLQKIVEEIRAVREETKALYDQLMELAKDGLSDEDVVILIEQFPSLKKQQQNQSAKDKINLAPFYATADLLERLGPDDKNFKYAVAVARLGLNMYSVYQQTANSTASGASTGGYIGAVIGFCVAIYDIDQQDKAIKNENEYRKALIRSIRALREDIDRVGDKITSKIQSSLITGEVQRAQIADTLSRFAINTHLQLSRIEDKIDQSAYSTSDTLSRMGLVNNDILREVRRVDRRAENRALDVTRQSEVRAWLDLESPTLLHGPRFLPEDEKQEIVSEQLPFTKYQGAMDTFLAHGTIFSHGPSANWTDITDSPDLNRQLDIALNIRGNEKYYQPTRDLALMLHAARQLGITPSRSTTFLDELIASGETDGIQVIPETQADFYNGHANLGWWRRNAYQFGHFASLDASNELPNGSAFSDRYFQYDPKLSKLHKVIVAGYAHRDLLETLLPADAAGRPSLHRLAPLFTNYERSLVTAIELANKLKVTHTTVKGYSTETPSEELAVPERATVFRPIESRITPKPGYQPYSEDEKLLLRVPALRLHHPERIHELFPDHLLIARDLLDGEITINYSDVSMKDGALTLLIQGEVTLPGLGRFRAFRKTAREEREQFKDGYLLSGSRLLQRGIVEWSKTDNLELNLLDPNNPDELSEEETTPVKELVYNAIDQYLADQVIVQHHKNKTHIPSLDDPSLRAFSELEGSKALLANMLSFYFDDPLVSQQLLTLPDRSTLLRASANSSKALQHKKYSDMTSQVLTYLSRRGDLSNYTGRSIALVDDLLGDLEGLYVHKALLHNEQLPPDDQIDVPQFGRFLFNTTSEQLKALEVTETHYQELIETYGALQGGLIYQLAATHSSRKQHTSSKERQSALEEELKGATAYRDLISTYMEPHDVSKVLYGAIEELPSSSQQEKLSNHFKTLKKDKFALTAKEAKAIMKRNLLAHHKFKGLNGALKDEIANLETNVTREGLERSIANKSAAIKGFANEISERTESKAHLEYKGISQVIFKDPSLPKKFRLDYREDFKDVPELYGTAIEAEAASSRIINSLKKMEDTNNVDTLRNRKQTLQRKLEELEELNTKSEEAVDTLMARAVRLRHIVRGLRKITKSSEAGREEKDWRAYSEAFEKSVWERDPSEFSDGPDWRRYYKELFPGN